MKTLTLELCLIAAKALREFGLCSKVVNYEWTGLRLYSLFYPKEAAKLSLLWFPYKEE
jgi:hypothetical protein